MFSDCAGDLVVASERLKIMHSHGILRGSKADIRALGYVVNRKAQTTQDSQMVLQPSSHTNS